MNMQDKMEVLNHLADSTPKGDAVVTGGNANEVITLPPMKKVIGHLEAANIIAGGFWEA